MKLGKQVKIMKKIIMMCCLFVLLCGCQKIEDQKQEENQTPIVEKSEATEKTLKVDASKDYVYVNSSVEANLSKEQLPYFEKRDKAIDTLVVNINSEDAKKVSEELKENAETLEAEMVNGEDGTLARFTSLSAGAMESDNYISILVKRHPFIWQSEGASPTYQVYVFDKKNGHLISQEDMLKELHLSDKDVVNKLKDIYEENNYEICGTEMAECYYEPEIYRNDEYMPDTAMYVNDNQDLVVYVRKSFGLGYTWEPVIIGLS